MKFQLPKLPYAFDALEPHISARTLELHYGKHHQGYMRKLEKAVGDCALAERSLEDIVLDSTGDIYNNAAQVWNHAFYWQSMRSNGGNSPGEELAARLKSDLGGIAGFKQAFAEAGGGEFGSGWAWLVETQSGRLKVLSTTDAENPLGTGARPLLTLDVWEHAYYLDYQNERGQYIEAYLDHLIDWTFAERNLAASKHKAAN